MAGIAPADNFNLRLNNSTSSFSPPKVQQIKTVGENGLPHFGPKIESAKECIPRSVTDRDSTMLKETVCYRNLKGTMYLDERKGLWRGYWNYGGKKGTPSSRSKKECEKKIKDALKRVIEGKADLDRLKPRQVRDLISAISLLEDIGEADFLSVVADYKRFRELAPKPSLTQAAECWRANHREIERISFSKAADHWFMNNRDNWKIRNTKSHGCRLKRFKASFQIDACDLTYEVVSEFFKDLEKTTVQKTRNHYRETLKAIIEHCVDQKWIKPDHGLACLLKPRKTNSRPPKALPPRILRELLKKASPDVLPCVAIMAFTGCRTSEIVKKELDEKGKEILIHLNWENVFNAAHKSDIEFSAHLTKTSRRRLSPIPPALNAWLAPYRGMTGHVWKGTQSAFEKEYSRLRKEIGIATKEFENCMRDSYISYQMALLNDAQKVASFAGNSPKQVYDKYRELKPREEAEEWFAVYPQQIQPNVIVAA